MRWIIPFVAIDSHPLPGSMCGMPNQLLTPNSLAYPFVSSPDVTNRVLYPHMNILGDIPAYAVGGCCSAPLGPYGYRTYPNLV